MNNRPDPVRPADETACAMAQDILLSARIAALAFRHPTFGTPFVSRIAIGVGPAGMPQALLSGIALHTQALRLDPDAALLLGEPPAKGDPLTGARLSLRVRAAFAEADAPDLTVRRADWLKQHPKAGLYIDLPDFRFVDLHPIDGLLNGGFGKAFHITAAELRGA